MDLTPYVNNLGREFATLAEAGGDEARALVERLTGSLESAIRMTLLDALSAAADEISRDLAPGSVELRLRGRDPSFVVTRPRPSPRPRARAARRTRPRTAGCSSPRTVPRADQRAPSRTAQGRDRGRRGQGGPFGQRLAGARGGGRPAAVRSRPASRAARRRQTGQAGSSPAGCAEPPLPTITHTCGTFIHNEGTTMPTYETPEPISVTLELGVGKVRITASDRTDTVVDVRPSDDTDESDVKAAQQVRVDYANGMLRIIGPKARPFDFSRKTRSVDVMIELPSGSQVSGRYAGRRYPRHRSARGVRGSRPRRECPGRANRAAAPRRLGRSHHR